MANHKQAEKRNRQRLTRTARNRAIKSRLRGSIKVARAAVASGDANAGELVAAASRLLDRAASKNAIPKQAASRLKSRLAKAANAAKG